MAKGNKLWIKEEAKKREYRTAEKFSEQNVFCLIAFDEEGELSMLKYTAQGHTHNTQHKIKNGLDEKFAYSN